MNLEENNGVPAPVEPNGEANPAALITEGVLVAASGELPEAKAADQDGSGDAEPAHAPESGADEAHASAAASEPVPDSDSESESEAPAQSASESEPDSGSDADAELASQSERDAAAPSPTESAEDDHPRLRRHHVAPAMIALDRLDDDRTFQMRPEGDIHPLATDIARLGQLFPIDIRFRPPDRFQVICGFRRVAALRFLQRDRVLARLHSDLGDEDALLMALVSAIHARPVVADELEQVKQKLAGQGMLSPSIRSMIDKALSPEDDLAPETVGDEQEVEAEQLAEDVTMRLGEINQDLSLLADVFDSLDDARQDQLLEQLRYSSQLVTYLEGRK